MKEAEQFFAAGFTDILYAVCIPPAKLDRALALRRQGCALTVLVDSIPSASAIVAKGKAEGHRFDVMIEIDSDGHRSGVRADDRRLIEIGRALQDGGAALKGVMTHAGSSYELDTPEALRRLAEQERRECVRAAERLRAAGLPCPEVSVGSTPTALSAAKLDGVTEVRAGVYALFDLVMANVGVCTPQDIALSVLTTVIGHQAEKGWTIVDAGWMAMSRDRGTQRRRSTMDTAPWAMWMQSDRWPRARGRTRSTASCRAATARSIPTWCGGFRWERRLRILPNHACATGAQFPEYQAITAHGVVQQWRRFDGW